MQTQIIDKKIIRRKEAYKRIEFFKNHITVFRHHWGKKGWHVETYPYINSIIFDKNMENAIIDFRLVFQGGYAYLRKTDNKWVLITSGLIWIE